MINFKKKYDRFWMAHCRTAYFSEKAKDLINKIFTTIPANRINVEEIMKHPWYQGTTLPASELAKTLAKRKERVDQENAKLKVQQQQLMGGETGTVRDFGDGNTDVDADMPNGTPQPIVVALKEGDDDNNDDDNDDVDNDDVDDDNDNDDEKKSWHLSIIQ
eukprot:TRINITY_DN1035_c0_g1_i1.p1 TRINITY_DN1035_c0_g1~~TRINITY_DN1035_c0_g1_i1.p1  ORF type:complete len:161 (-),score=59.23 TRINITY_DN1035_c0_g1_i1:78-560(-)